MNKAEKKYNGVVVAMPTPCSRPCEADPAQMKRLCRFLEDSKCDGLFVLSSTGELAMLDEDDRRKLVSAAREECCDDTVLYAGVSGMGLKQSIRHAVNAARDGADVAIVMAPFFLKLNQDELFAYVTSLADASPIPVGIYHHFRMASQFDVETVGKLACHPNIIAMKDTSRDLERIGQLVKITEGKLSVFQGSERILFESLKLGACGCVTALASIVPQWHRDLIDSWAAGDVDGAKHAQDKILGLVEVFNLPELGESFAHFAYAIKIMLKFTGVIKNADTMIPGFVPSEEYTQKIHNVVKNAGVI